MGNPNRKRNAKRNEAGHLEIIFAETKSWAKFWVLLGALLSLVGCTRSLGGTTVTPIATTVQAPDQELSEAPPLLKILTYNMHHGRGEDDVINLDRIAAVIQDVDIALLNEVDVNWPRSDFVDQAHGLAIKAGFEYYAYAPSLILPQVGRDVAQYGNAILSRHPIVSASRHALPQPPGKEPRTALMAAIDVHGTRLTVITTHLGLNADERLAQVDALMSVIERVQHPFVVAGDFNAFPDSPEVTRLSSYLVDTHHRIAPGDDGFTFPNPHPTARIDYVFTSKDLAPYVLKHEVRSVSGSDHLPVVVHIDRTCFNKNHSRTVDDCTSR